MTKNEPYDLVIIGGGPGGLAAGLYAMRAALNTLLIEKGMPGGQVAISKGVENYLGFEEITGFDLSDRFLKHAQGYGLEVIQKEAVSIDPGLELQAVHLSGGETVQARAIIVAVGGVARKLDVPGEAESLGRGVSYCATCDGFFFKDKPVMVVGGGDTAIEDALYLAKIAKLVYLVHRRDAFRAGKILQQRVMAEPKIKILWNAVVRQIKMDDQGVNAVSLESTQTGDQQELAVEGVFVCIGFSPNNQLVPQGVRMNAEGYVVTDEKCETNIPGIFVVGDLRQKYARQIIIAAADGCTAALAAAHYIEMKKGQQGDDRPS